MKIPTEALKASLSLREWLFKRVNTEIFGPVESESVLPYFAELCGIIPKVCRFGHIQPAQF